MASNEGERIVESLERKLTEEEVSRRDFFVKAGKAGIAAGGLLSFPAFLAACGGGTTTTTAATTATTTAATTATTAGQTATTAAAATGKTFADIFPGGAAAGQGVTFQDGMMLAMTGQGSFFGKVMSQGAQFAAKQIKANGGPDFVINIADHESGLVPPAMAGMRRLTTQNKIKTLQTSYGAPSEAIIPLIQTSKVLSFNGGGSSPGQLSKDFLWMTRMLFAYDPTDGGLAWLAKEKPDAKKLALVGTNENGVEVWKEKAPRIWPKLQSGGTIVATEIHDVGLTDFAPIIARVKAAGADAVFTVSFGDDLGYMVKQFREANYEGPIVGIEFTEQAAKVAGASYDTYNFATDYFDVESKNPWTAMFVKEYTAEYGEAPEYYGSNYYEQVFVIWELVRRVIAAGGDPQDTTLLQQALKDKPEFYSVYGGDESTVGTMSFDLNDHSISKPMGVFGVKGGKPFLIVPIKKVSATDDPATALLA